jgi:hypothetical protein
VVANNNFSAHHARAELPQDFDHTVALTALTRVRLGLVLASGTLALPADRLLVGSELDSLALVKLFKCDLVFLLLIRALARLLGSTGAAGTSRTTRASHAEAEHLGQDVVDIDLRSTGSASGLVESGHAVYVVGFTLLVIAEDFVGFCALLEDDLRLFALLFWDLVGVVFQGSLVEESAIDRS